MPQNLPPQVTLNLDKPRVWCLDVPAFERVCDGFDEVGFPEFAENPLLSIEEFRPSDDKAPINRRLSKIMRVWMWAGLTGEDADLTLKDAAKLFGPGTLIRHWTTVMPVLAETISPLEPAAREPKDAPASDGGQLAATTSA